MDVAVALVGDGVAVLFRDDGEGVEYLKGVVLGGPQHLKLEMEDIMPEAVGVLHAAFSIQREGVLEVHHLGVQRPADPWHGPQHLAVDDIGVHLFGKRLKLFACFQRIPIAQLERLRAKVVADDVLIVHQLGRTDEAYLLTIGFHGTEVLGQYLHMRHAEEVNVVAFRELFYLIESPQLVTLLQRVREPWQYN